MENTGLYVDTVVFFSGKLKLFIDKLQKIFMQSIAYIKLTFHICFTLNLLC
jgi:hypothetical protein